MKISRTFVAVLAFGVAGAVAAAGGEAGKDGFVAIKSSQIKWADAPSVAPGAKLAVLEGSPKAKGPFTMRVLLPANTKVPVHTHPAVERVTVLSGAFHFAVGDKYDAARTEAYRPGDGFIVPAGMPMFGFTKEETVIQLHGIGPWGMNYLNPADAPGKKR
jgi:quercetin dioxygenase-like cupin family protein